MALHLMLRQQRCVLTRCAALPQTRTARASSSSARAQRQAQRCIPPAAAAAAAPGPAPHHQQQQQPQRKVLLLDGHNAAMRCFWGIIKSPLSALQTSDGIPTTVTFGFCRTLLALLEQEQPDAVVVVFDAPGGSTFRRELLPTYKAHRQKPAPDFVVDLANLQLLLRFFRIPSLSVPGFEADDVMAGLAAQASESGWHTLLVTTDKDLWQVVDDAGGVSVLLPSSSVGSKGSKSSRAGQHVDEAAVREGLGVPPSLVPDLKALMGDASDGIAGVKGIGLKTAMQLLQKHGDLAGVFLHAADEKPGVAGKLAGQQEQAELCRRLATVRPEAAPAGYDFAAARLQGFAASEVEPLLRRLQMTSLVKDLPRLQGLLGGVAAADPQLTAALAPALEQIAASAQAVLTQQDSSSSSGSSGDAGAHPQHNPAQEAGEGSSSSNSSSSSGSGGSGGSSSRAAAAAVTTPQPPPNAATSLSDSVLVDVPSLRLVTTPLDLQALVSELQQQPQVTVTWGWPQTSPYTPGLRPPLPLGLCCAWQPHTQPQPVSPAASQPTPPAPAAPAAPAPGPPAPRRRRRTRASTTHIQQYPQQQVAQSASQQPPPVQQQQQQQQVLDEHLQQSVGGAQLAVVMPGDQLPASAVLAAVKPLLESSSHPKCLFESKRAFTELQHQGIQLQGVAFDVLVAGCLPDPERWSAVLNPEQQQAAVLPVMVQHDLHTSLADMAAALQQAAAGQERAPAWVWLAAAEAWATLLLRPAFTASMQRLRDGGQLQQLLDSVEVPLQRVLSAMEVAGVRCDKQVLLQQATQLQAEVAALEQQLHSLAGGPFNLRSPKECSRVIYDELQLGLKGVKRTKSGYLSTSMSEIEKLADSPFKQAFVEWSRLSSLLSKYYNAGPGSYIGSINPDTGRIHTTYHQVGVATGRLASSNPNMQNTPAHDTRGKMFRAAFKADQGHILVAADYSQVELRVMAALSGDEALLAAFADGQDVHAATARQVLGKTPEEPLTTEERQLGKRVNFSIVYGAGARQLASDLGMKQKEAQQFLDNFKASHPKLFEFKTHCMRSAVARGYTLSATGRRRTHKFSSPRLQALRGVDDLSQLPDMKGLQKLAGRDDVHVLLQATNAPIQSTSADVLKAALIQLHARLSPPPYSCRLLLTAHDDVLLEVPHQHWPALRSVVAEIMQGALAPQHRLMLQADVSAGGDTWLNC